MKRLFAFLLACVCALALFGCAGANDDKSDGGPEDDTTPLTETQIEEFKELFASTADVTDETTGEYRYTTSTPVSCFFTSHYDDPRDIDLAEFLRYCPLSTTLGDADVEEFHAVLDTLGIENAERFKVPDDWAVPVRRMPKSDVSALLMQWISQWTICAIRRTRYTLRSMTHSMSLRATLAPDPLFRWAVSSTATASGCGARRAARTAKERTMS